MSDCFNGSSAGHAPERRHRSAGGCSLRCGRVTPSGYRCMQRVRPHPRADRRDALQGVTRASLGSGARHPRDAHHCHRLCLDERVPGGPRRTSRFLASRRERRLRDKGTRLRSHQFTDARGRYWLQTILPGPYANRTRHVHVTVRARGERTVTTMLYFPGVALNAHDPFIDRHLIVRLRLEKHRLLARFDFILGSR
jgi:hypothetical protein